MAKPLTREENYDLFCNQRLNNPYPLFARLRAEDPVHWSEPMKCWLITRYDDALRALKDDYPLLSSREGIYSDPLLPENRERAQPLIDHLTHWMLSMGPPSHTRLRKLVGLAFTPRMVRSMEPMIRRIVDDLLDQISGDRQTDFIQSFCLPLPATVICEMLGIPTEHRNEFRECVDGLLPFSSAGGPGLNDHIDQARQSLDTLIGFFDALIDERRAQPKDDLLSAMAAAEADGDRLTKEELFAMCVFLFVAGHETTMGLLASGTLALLQHTDQLERMKADPKGLVATAVEEFLRYEAPVTRAVRRAAEDFEWRGRQIRKGETTVTLLGAANRDPEQFPDPDRLDIGRDPNKHLGFGFGIHFCIGAPLARLEGKVAFPAILERFPNMQLAADRIEYQPAFGIRSIKALPVALA